jgi:hypothetical protein
VCRQSGHNRRVCPNQPIEHGRAQRAQDQLVEGKYTLIFMCIKLTIIDSEAESEAESPPVKSPPAEFSDWDGFSDTLSFNSASDAFTDNHTDSEPEGINTSWLYVTVEEQDKDTAHRRTLQCRNRHIRERDQRRLAKEVDSFQFDDDNILFDIWTAELVQDQDQDQDQIQVQILAEIQGQEVDLDQDTGLQKRQYQGQELDLDQDTRPQKHQYQGQELDLDQDNRPQKRRYPLRKRQLTAKAAALII